MVFRKDRRMISVPTNLKFIGLSFSEIVPSFRSRSPRDLCLHICEPPVDLSSLPRFARELPSLPVPLPALSRALAFLRDDDIILSSQVEFESIFCGGSRFHHPFDGTLGDFDRSNIDTIASDKRIQRMGGIFSSPRNLRSLERHER